LLGADSGFTPAKIYLAFPSMTWTMNSIRNEARTTGRCYGNDNYPPENGTKSSGNVFTDNQFSTFHDHRVQISFYQQVNWTGLIETWVSHSEITIREWSQHGGNEISGHFN
jgi:hypothetical protein